MYKQTNIEVCAGLEVTERGEGRGRFRRSSVIVVNVYVSSLCAHSHSSQLIVMASLCSSKPFIRNDCSIFEFFIPRVLVNFLSGISIQEMFIRGRIFI